MSNETMDKLIATMAKIEHPQIHLVDIENLIGSGRFNTWQVRKAKHLYEKMVHPLASDIVIIAAGPQNKRAIYEGWGHALYCWRKGKDGADQALLSFFGHLEKPRTFSAVYLGSGDGGLAPIAHVTTQLGVPFTVVARGSNCSWKLKKFNVINFESEEL
jgi:hypothetical protein